MDIREEIELLRDEIIRDRIVLGAKNAKLLFVDQPSNHPYPRKLWTEGLRDFSLIEKSGAPPLWHEPTGQNIGWMRCRTEDGGDLVSYDAFLVAHDRGTEKFMQIAIACGALLLPDPDHPYFEFVKELFEFSRLNGRLTWETNEQPGHPETRRRIAWLHDVFDAVVGFLNAKLELSPPAFETLQKQPTHSADFRSVNWFGTLYEFTGLQAACVKVLWEAMDNKTPTVGDTTILEAAESNAERLGLVFRDHAAWGTMIVEGQTKGTHRLAEPPMP